MGLLFPYVKSLSSLSTYSVSYPPSSPRAETGEARVVRGTQTVGSSKGAGLENKKISRR